MSFKNYRKDGYFMKKTTSLIIAVVIALTAICTVSVMAFAKTVEITEAPTTSAAADSTSSTKAPATTDPQNAKNTTATTKAASTKSPADIIADLSSAVDKLGSTTLPNKPTEDSGDVVTNPSGVTAVDDSGDNTTKAAVSSTRKAAPVSGRVPNTGSSIAVPAIAVLALVAGTVAVVKTKKNED